MKRFFSYVLLMIKGALFGIANLIPGVSGGTIAVVSGVYNKILYSINNLFKQFGKSILFLGVFAIGTVLAILFGSKGIDYCLDKFPIQTACLFIGLMLGGLPIIGTKIRNSEWHWYYLFIAILAVVVVCALTFVPKTASRGNEKLEIYEYLILGALGYFASVAMVVPGISGMMMFKLFGYYDSFMSVMANLTKWDMLGYNILYLMPIGIGIIVGIFSAAKFIGFLLRECPIGTYYAIIGFVVGSILVLLVNGRELSATGERLPSVLGYFAEAVKSGNFISYVLDHWITFSISLALIIVGYMAIFYLGLLSEKSVIEKEEIDPNDKATLQTIIEVETDDKPLDESERDNE